MEKKYLVIDTETSGLFDFSQPADADGQPRLASVSMLSLDEQLLEVANYSVLIKPEGWQMEEAASRVNGLTTEQLTEHGQPIAVVLDRYGRLVDEGFIVVAFNAQFDTKVMRGEMRRAGVSDRFENTPTICTMRASTEIVKVPKKTGKGWKFPKLHEACSHFKITNEGAHSSLHDARACAEILRKLVALGACPEPAVYFAKERP